MMMTMMRMAKQNRRFCVWRTKSYHDDDDDDDNDDDNDDDDGGGGSRGNANEIDDYDGDDEGDNNGEYEDDKVDKNDNDDDDDAFCPKLTISCWKLPCVNDSPSCAETVSLNAAGISTRSWRFCLIASDRNCETPCKIQWFKFAFM